MDDCPFSNHHVSYLALFWRNEGAVDYSWLCYLSKHSIGLYVHGTSQRAKARLVPFEEKEWHPSQMMTDDPIAAEVMTRALNSGNIVFANLDDDELFDALRSDRLKGEDARQFAYRKVGNRYQQYAQTMMGG